MSVANRVSGPKVFSWSGSGGVTADSPLAFYADESGNTGANHLDAAQPFYVTGGWLIRQSDVPLAEAFIAGVLASTDLRELKGSQLLKTTRGRKAANELVPRLLGFCTPILVIIEKTFALGARIFDDFVMYPSGPFFPNLPDREVGRRLTTILAMLPRPTLACANDYLSERSPERVAECATLLERSLIVAGHEELAEVVRKSSVAPAAWWTRGEIQEKSISPNVTGYTTLLQMLEILGLECGQKISLVHDEFHQLAHVYEFYQSYAARADLSQSAAFFEQAGCPGRIAHVSSPKFEKSHAEPMIQAADVLCGIATSFLSRDRDALASAGDGFRDLALLSLWGFVEPDLSRYFTFVGLAESGMRFGQSLVDLFSEHPLYGDRD